jgi:hypothetical protein
MNHVEEWRAANERNLEKVRQEFEPPTAEELAALYAGELSPEDEERVLDLVVAYPDVALTFLSDKERRYRWRRVFKLATIFVAALLLALFAIVPISGTRDIERIEKWGASFGTRVVWVQSTTERGPFSSTTKHAFERIYRVRTSTWKPTDRERNTYWFRFRPFLATDVVLKPKHCRCPQPEWLWLDPLDAATFGQPPPTRTE